MGNYSDVYEQKINDKVWGAIDFTPPATIYFGFSSTEPNGAGQNITEPSGNGYARASVTNNTSNFPAGNPKTNAVAIVFPEPTGPGWGLQSYWFAADHPTNVGSAVIGFGDLAPPVTIGPTSSPRWGAGTVSLAQE
jgi:ABC-type phosphate transport system substrate-binding protein